ncbi:MAG: hypothetical protein F6K21_23505 [Symploca sp. SIO2D2]|nr:hypothetical protein [Symploca sp. SIO2D2]
MQTIKLKSVVNADGIVQLKVPRELANQELELIVVYQPVETNSMVTPAEALGYPADFFEKTAGAWQGEALTRGEQGICDERQW